MTKPIIIIGGGGHACVLAETLRAAGRHILGFLDEVPKPLLQSLTCLGGDGALSAFDPETIELANGIGGAGDTGPRRAVYQRLRAQNYHFATIIHPSAVIASDALLDEGVQVMAGAILQVGVTIAENAIINSGAIVDHHCRIDAHVHIAPGAVLSGSVTVGASAHVGTGASIIQGRTIGAGSLVGAGAVVLKDVAPGTRVFGVPANPVARTL